MSARPVWRVANAEDLGRKYAEASASLLLGENGNDDCTRTQQAQARQAAGKWSASAHDKTADPKGGTTEKATMNWTIKHFNADRGFGFIKPEDGSADVFFHISALPEDAAEPDKGAPVQFEMGTGRDGRAMARNVRLI